LRVEGRLCYPHSTSTLPKSRRSLLKIRVRFFALYRERAKQDALILDLPKGAIVSDATDELLRCYPGLAPNGTPLVVALNAKYATPGTPLKDGDELALIPPVSGGSDLVEISPSPLSAEAIVAKVKRNTSGAVVTFLGTVRNNSHGKQVEYLEYEAYPEMAAKVLEEIRENLKTRWSIEEVAISHRTGRVDVGEISLVVAIASAHRKEAFQACIESIDLIKRSVPIWKKEVFSDGYVWIGREAEGL
jgi:molybdopterin synthase catalytic subunit